MIIIEVICKPRGTGKTHDLIMKSAETGIPILSAFEVGHIKYEAKELGVKIPEPMSLREYQRLKKNGGFHGMRWNEKLLIDDVDYVLKKLLDAEVETATLTPNDYNELYNDAIELINNDTNKAIEEENNMPTETNNLNGLTPSVNVTLANGKTYTLSGIYNSNYYFDEINPDEITDVNVIVPNKVVEVTFSDGTKQKAVCQDPDVFSLEMAISICISKKIMGGSSAYNNAIRRGVKVYENKLKKIEADKAEQERIANKRAKREEYKARRAAKREAAEKEKAIEIQKEAYVRAMEEMENRKNGENS